MTSYIRTSSFWKYAFTALVSVILSLSSFIGYTETRFRYMMKTETPYVQDKRMLEEIISTTRGEIKELKEALKITSLSLAKTNKALVQLTATLRAKNLIK